MRVRTLVALLLVFATACTGAPDRRSQLADLTAQIRAMPGVTQAGNTINDDVARGPAYFELDVEVADDISADQVAVVTSAYLDALPDYGGYSAALDVRRGDNIFTVSTGDRPVEHRDQIVAQARSWVRLRQLIPGSTVDLRATTKAASSSGTIQLPDTADYTAVTTAVGKLGTDFGDLTGGDWTVSAGKQQPGDPHFPTPAEPARIELWTALNADQSIPHAEVLTINSPVTGPLWVSEKTGADDPELALRLASSTCRSSPGCPYPCCTPPPTSTWAHRISRPGHRPGHRVDRWLLEARLPAVARRAGADRPVRELSPLSHPIR